MKHWSAEELHKAMREQGLDIPGLAVLAGLTVNQVRDFFAGKCLMTIVNIEKLAGALHYEFDLHHDGTPSPAVECRYCGPVIPLLVHGHTQCPKCQGILKSCCED